MISLPSSSRNIYHDSRPPLFRRGTIRNPGIISIDSAFDHRQTLARRSARGRCRTRQLVAQPSRSAPSPFSLLSSPSRYAAPRDNRIPRVTPANRVEICANRARNSVTRKNREGGERTPEGRLRPNPRDPQVGATVSQDRIHKPHTIITAPPPYILTCTRAIPEKAFPFRRICIRLCELTRQKAPGMPRTGAYASSLRFPRSSSYNRLTPPDG